jgi:teichuronic acid exporter
MYYEFIVNNYKSKAIRGSISYFIRQVLVAGINFFSNLLILRWLNPQDFGYFATISLVMGLAQIFAEGGLSVYLVQREKEVDDKVLSEIATLQLILYSVVHSIILVVLTVRYLSNAESPMLLYVFVAIFCIPVSIFRANSFVGLERHLLFGKIATIEVAESLFYSATSLTLAFMGMGVWSLIWALIVRALVGYIFSSLYGKWRFSFRLPSFTDDLKKGIRYGINYHIPTLVTTLRIAINPILVGGLLGLTAVGVADRAMYFAGLPLFFLGTVQQRVLFPYFARIQSDSNMVRSNFEKSFYISAIIDKIFYIPIVLYATELINMFFPKWSQTIPLIYVAMLGNIAFGALSYSFFPTLSGIGKSGVIAKLSVLSLVLTWVFTWPLIWFFGLIGYAYVGLLIWVVGAVPSIVVLRKYIKGVSLWRPLIIPLLAFCCSTIMLRFYTESLQTITLPIICLFSTLAILLYCVLLALLDGRYIFRMLTQLRLACSQE